MFVYMYNCISEFGNIISNIIKLEHTHENVNYEFED